MSGKNRKALRDIEPPPRRGGPWSPEMNRYYEFSSAVQDAKGNTTVDLVSSLRFYFKLLGRDLAMRNCITRHNIMQCINIHVFERYLFTLLLGQLVILFNGHR